MQAGSFRVGEFGPVAGVSNGSGARMLVLVVDDEESLCELLAEVLAGEYEVIKAFNGKTAYEIAREVKPDLIISDVMMPQMSGVELLKALRNVPDTAHIPVILLSAVPLKAKIAEASAFLAKPFEIEVLEKVVAKVAHEEAQTNEADTPDRPPATPRLNRPDFKAARTAGAESGLERVTGKIVISESGNENYHFFIPLISKNWFAGLSYKAQFLVLYPWFFLPLLNTLVCRSINFSNWLALTFQLLIFN